MSIYNFWAIPEEAKPWLGVPLAYMLHRNVSGPLRQMDDEQLRRMAGSIGLNAITLPHLLRSWRLPQLEGPGFWLGTVAPAIKSELERRRKPKRAWGANSPIDLLKTVDIVDVASRFTDLMGHGNRLKGLCPLHQERTPSFYVYGDSQRWRCYGGCAEGGDIVDLLRRLGDQGKLQ